MNKLLKFFQNRKIKENSQKSKTYSRIKEIVKPHIKRLIIISILALLVSICEITRPFLIEQVIDNYLAKGLYTSGFLSIGIIGAIYITLVLLGSILNFISLTSTNIIGENVIYDIRNRLFKYTQYANIPFHDKTPAGKLFVRITNDAEDISTLFKDVLSTFFKDVLLIIVMVCIMIYFSLKLSLVSFIVIPFIVIFSIFMTNILNKISTQAKNIRTQLNTFIAESIYGAKIIKIFNIQREKKEECKAYTKAFKDKKSKQGIFEALLPGVMGFLQNIGISLILFTCLNHWFGVTLEIGYIYIFITYLKQFLDPLTKMVENIEIIEEAIVSIDKIYSLLEKEEYLENFEEGIKLDNIKGKIEFKDVWFSYDNENWVLKGVSFTVEPGQNIALVGKTGSRKNYYHKSY